MRNRQIVNFLGLLFLVLGHTSCRLPALGRQAENRAVPAAYNGSRDTANTAKTAWQDLFTDANLKALIDTALKNNQELNIVLQEINIARNEARVRKGNYLPFAGIVAGSGVEKASRYTSRGASDAITEIAPGKPTPEVLPDHRAGLMVSWEADIWKKLRNSRKAAVYKYLATMEGKNFMVTRLVAEIANAYYELMALDNQLDILQQNIAIQQNALEIVKLEKISARVSELAVRRFEAEVLKNQSRQFYILQQIRETENRINFLAGRFPQSVARNSRGFTALAPDSIRAGIPSQLLQNRADIRQAERELAGARLDVKAARAEFYPALRITAGAGYQAFNPAYLIKTPQALIFSLAGELVAPLINRNAIRAGYYSAGSRQIQAVYNYERAILRAHIEVVNQLSNIENLGKSYEMKTRQVEALTRSIDISTGLFKSARADYMEVLLTQRDALESRFELIETKKQQMNAMVNIYQALGGGWK